MPIIISFFARQLIIIGVQLGIFALIDKFVTPLLNQALAAIVSKFGVDQNIASDILANEVISTAESLGLTVALSKARLPLALADKLGFTTKGFSKRAIRSDIAPVVTAAKASGVVGAIELIVPGLEESNTIVTAAKTNVSGFSVAYNAVLKLLSVTFIGFIAVNNMIDFGNWNSGAYQKTFQKIFAFVTGGLLVPDENYRTTKTVSPTVFDKVYNTYKDNGAYAISDPFKKASVMFTRDNMIDLLDQVGAKLLLATGKAATKDVLLASQLMISFPLALDTAPATTTLKPAAGVAVSLPTTKVFTGVVSQGVLGTGLVFAARPDDLIGSADELQAAASNNLAATLAALPASLSYEIKIVSSIITKDGFRQTGSSQQIVSGYKADGTPKYRNVINRFAVLSIFLTNEKGTRTKIRTITLGPTDVVKFNPTLGQLAAAETAIKSSVSTANLSDIHTVVTNSPLAVLPVQSPAPAPVAPANLGDLQSAYDIAYERYHTIGDGYVAMISTRAALKAALGGVEPKTTAEGGNGSFNAQSAPAYATALAPDDPSNKFNTATGALNPRYVPPGSTSGSICSAKTLYELSVAQGTSLPTVAMRAPDYERLGLGQAAYYTGTAEQNTKLLKALQKELGCPG